MVGNTVLSSTYNLEHMWFCNYIVSLPISLDANQSLKCKTGGLSHILAIKYQADMSQNQKISGINML